LTRVIVTVRVIDQKMHKIHGDIFVVYLETVWTAARNWENGVREFGGGSQVEIGDTPVGQHRKFAIRCCKRFERLNAVYSIW
jgi:hypothetical protein